MIKRLFLAFFVAVLLWLAYEVLTFPDVGKLAKEPPKTTAFMELRKKQLRAKGEGDELRWKWVSYGNISPSLRRAVLVAEDDSFYEHHGVDVDAMKEAFERNWKGGKVTHGGSTITQQLAKNLYLSPSRNPVRKIKEYFIARALEKHLTKKRILELYLNVVEFGERVYGAEAAARHYFHKSASALSPKEAALLAGCLPNPRIMNPGDPNKRLRWRQKMILSRMRRWGYLFEKQVLAEKKPEPEATATADTATALDTAATDSTDTTIPEETATTETTATTATEQTGTTATATETTETSATETTNTDTTGTQ